MNREKTLEARSGIGMLVLFLVALAGCVVWLIMAISAESAVSLLGSILSMVLVIFFMAGLFTVHPNEAKVLQLFGAYRGTVHVNGLRWANPFYSKVKVSVRTRNFETGSLKVNDNHGNPIEIGSVVVWRVVDTAEALFNVDDYQDFVHVQSEAALRNLATGYPYVVMEEDEEEVALVSHTAEISGQLRNEVQQRLEEAGVEVIEARISHLAYAQEIAAAMLQRQQATAVVAARQQIVKGAVGMVEHALEMLSERGVVALDEERRASMVSNLLVVLCSDRHTQPVVNTGTLYN